MLHKCRANLMEKAQRLLDARMLHRKSAFHPFQLNGIPFLTKETEQYLQPSHHYVVATSQCQQILKLISVEIEKFSLQRVFLRRKGLIFTPWQQQSRKKSH